MLLAAIARKMKIKYAEKHLKNKDISIISNNCLGAVMSHELGLRLNSPTVNLQIPPEDYLKFVSDLEYYLGEDLKELTEFSPEDMEKIKRLYKRDIGQLKFPFGKIGNGARSIIICFQHYGSFEEARDSWNRRRGRVNTDNVGFIFFGVEEFKEEMEELDRLDLPKKIVFTNAFDLVLENTETVRVDLPDGALVTQNRTPFKKYYEYGFNVIRWIDS